MAKVIYIDNDGNETLLREGRISPSEVWFANDYFAYKLWSDEDIGGQLYEKGYERNDENIAKVKYRGYDILDVLHDCTDEDWELINKAIEEASKYETLEKREDI